MSKSSGSTKAAEGPLPGRRAVKVCIVAPSPESVGGQSVQAQQLICKLAETAEVDVSFVPTDPPLWGPLRPLRRVRYLRTALTWVAYLATLIARAPRIDVLHVFSASYSSFLLTSIPAILVSKLFARPLLLNYHSGEADDHLTRSRRVAVPLLRRVDAIVVPSDYLVDVFARHGLPAQSIANIIDPEHCSFRWRRPLRPSFLGNRNFAPLYNVACVVRAFARIKKARPDATLTLAGDGECRNDLERLVRELGLRSSVSFVGQVPPEQMPRLYDEADVYLNGSDVDNMPLSILEAFACGLPVVTTDAGGIPYIVEHERTGLLVSRDDDEALADQALRLFAEPGLAERITDAAQQACRAHYTWAAVERRWLTTYTTLSRRRPGR